MPAAARNHVTVQGHSLNPPRHICCFFESRNQQYETLIPYFAEGLANGEKVMSVMDRDLIPDHDQRLSQAGIRVDSVRQSGQICTYCVDDTYLQGGCFAKHRMLTMLKNELAQLAHSGFSRLRTCGDMSWVLRNMPGTAEFLEYESEVNTFLGQYDATFMCVYDANQISGSTMRDILNTHSHILLGNVLYVNPYYLTPEEYNRTIITRRAAARHLDAGDS